MTTNGEAVELTPNTETSELKCGLVMPISAHGDYSEQHWQDVKAIFNEAIDSAGFKANLVSDADDVGVIQKRIIQNLYDNPIVVCDVSGKNPNVMFELGLRLAFDKPTIIVKDDATSYSFDTAPIEHLEYPRDLRFNKIVEFKSALKEKITATHKRATTDPSYTTFLKHFGKFHVAQLETKEVSREDYIIEELRDLKHLIIKKDARNRSERYWLNERLRHSYSEDDYSAMQKEVAKAITHLSEQGHPVSFPRSKLHVLDYISRNDDLISRFKTPKEFEGCLDKVIQG